MQGSSANSFIPKRKSSDRQRSVPKRKIFFITIIAYSLIFAALLAAGGSLLYKNLTLDELEKEAVLLDTEVNTFSVRNFKRVQDANIQLEQASFRVANTVSVSSILTEMDRIVAQPIQIENLEIERTLDQDLSLKVSFRTETLDAALFQRKLMSTNSELFVGVEISEIDLQDIAETDQSDSEDPLPGVAFVAEFSIPVRAALYDPAQARRTDIGTSLQRSFPVITPQLEEEGFDEQGNPVSLLAPESDDIINETAL